MNKAKRDKILLAVLVIGIICLIMFYVSIKPCIDEVKRLNAQISSARESIDNLKGKSQLINELKKQLGELEAEVKEAEGNMPSFTDLSLYLADFQDITDGRATDTKITFSSMAPSESGYYSIVQAKVEFVCNYEDLKYIMSALLENKVHCYDVVIKGVAQGDEEEAVLLDVTFTADYISGTDTYIPGDYDYDFTSGRYGLSALFDNVITGSAIGDAEGGEDN